ncbi:MAG TPA: SgcJ/EcaC family oxidoreductase [Mycobacterium sp.]|nr:SgcJ/EcaC family oxidoreductase [Mycobacterium sp.]
MTTDLVKQLLADFEACMNDRDAERFSELFTADGDFVDFMGGWQHGRPSIRDGHAMAFEGFLAHGAFRFTSKTIDESSAGVAVCHALWVFTGQQDAQGQAIGDRTGIITLVIVPTVDGPALRAGQNTEHGRALTQFSGG